MIWLVFYKLGHGRGALRHGFGATRMATTSAWRIDRARHVSLKDDLFSSGIGVHLRDGKQQSLGVRMHGVIEVAVARSDLNELSQIHTGNAVPHRGANAKVM